MSDKTYWLKRQSEGTEFDFIDQDGISHRSPAEWLWSDIMGGCGCGSSEELADRAVSVLDIFADGTDYAARVKFFEDPANEILAHWIDSVGLLEHGTIFTGSWLTEQGKQVHKHIHEFDFPEVIEG